jgi:hypothetical protein
MFGQLDVSLLKSLVVILETKLSMVNDKHYSQVIRKSYSLCNASLESHCVSFFVYFFLSENRCGELSADHDEEEENEYRQTLKSGLAQNNSQLSLIFNILGNPSDEDIAALDPNTASILRQAPYRSAMVSGILVSFLSCYLAITLLNNFLGCCI